MLSTVTRLRPRLTPVSLSLPTEDDTDDSSPERVTARKSLLLVPHHQRVKPPSLKHRDLDQAVQPLAKPTLIRRVTSKLHISIPSKPVLQSRPSTHTPSVVPTNGPRPNLPLPNGFTSKQHREAALRERGLLPPRKDLSQQEREADDRLASAPSPSTSTDANGLSEAERLKATWLAKNRSSSDTGSSDLAPSPPPHLDVTPTRPPSTPASRSPSALPKIDVRCQSAEARSPSVGRPSISSSVPPLSASSALEVLHEDPSEHPLITPAMVSPSNVPIVISSPVDYFPSSLNLVESPISCTFSSLYPGSTADSQSQSDHSRLHDNGDTCRGRRSTSGGSPRRMGSSLSRVGSRSLSNIRRSIVGSLRLPSSATLSSTDTPPSPRTAISPTIHNIGSIIRETRDIADAESRRLSELAFLD